MHLFSGMQRSTQKRFGVNNMASICLNGTAFAVLCSTYTYVVFLNYSQKIIKILFTDFVFRYS